VPYKDLPCPELLNFCFCGHVEPQQKVRVVNHLGSSRYELGPSSAKILVAVVSSLPSAVLYQNCIPTLLQTPNNVGRQSGPALTRRSFAK
jgi:hypothetical protein